MLPLLVSSMRATPAGRPARRRLSLWEGDRRPRADLATQRATARVFGDNAHHLLALEAAAVRDNVPVAQR